MTKVCIIGKEEVNSKRFSRVKEDIIISTIRKIKRFFKIAKESELVVCDQHLEEALKRRKEFESSIVKVVALVAVIAVIAILLALLNKSFSFVPVTISILILVFILLIFVSLFRYFPAVENHMPEKVKIEKAEQIAKREGKKQLRKSQKQARKKK